MDIYEMRKKSFTFWRKRLDFPSESREAIHVYKKVDPDRPSNSGGVRRLLDAFLDLT